MKTEVHFWRYQDSAGITKKRMYCLGLPGLEYRKNARIIDIAEDQEIGPRKIPVEKQRIWIRDESLSEQTIEAIKNGKYHQAVWGACFSEDYLGMKTLTGEDTDTINSITGDYSAIRDDTEGLFRDMQKAF